MPQRFLRPGLTTSKRWNRCSYFEQSMYIRLITLVDDYGRYEADPELIRAHAFPFGDPKGKAIPQTTIVVSLQTLVDCGLLSLYEIEGKQYLQLLRWQERSRYKSRFPEPKDNLSCLKTTKVTPSSSSTPSPSPSPSPSYIATTQPVGWSIAEGFTGISNELKKEFKATYPACDIDRQLRDMNQWLLSNPVKAKKSNWRQFVTNWLRRSQDRGGDTGSSKKQADPNQQHKDAQYERFLRERAERKAREVA